MSPIGKLPLYCVLAASITFQGCIDLEVERKNSGDEKSKIDFQAMVDACKSSTNSALKSIQISDSEDELKLKIQTKTASGLQDKDPTDLRSALKNAFAASDLLVSLHIQRDNPKYDGIKIIKQKIVELSAILKSMNASSLQDSFPNDIDDEIKNKVGEIVAFYKVMNLVGSVIQLTMITDSEIDEVSNVLGILDKQVTALESNYFPFLDQLDVYNVWAYMEITSDIVENMLVNPVLQKDYMAGSKAILEDLYYDLISPSLQDPGSIPQSVKVSEVLSAQKIEDLSKQLSADCLSEPKDGASDVEINLFRDNLALRVRFEILKGIAAAGK